RRERSGRRRRGSVVVEREERAVGRRDLVRVAVEDPGGAARRQVREAMLVHERLAVTAEDAVHVDVAERVVPLDVSGGREGGEEKESREQASHRASSRVWH